MAFASTGGISMIDWMGQRDKSSKSCSGGLLVSLPS